MGRQRKAQVPRFTKDDFMKAIPGSNGVISVVAGRVGCSRRTVYNAINGDPEIKQALYDAREELKDMAESVLFTMIKERNITALIFYLKTQARDRGYVERQEVQIDYRDRLREDYEAGRVSEEDIIAAGFSGDLARELFQSVGIETRETD